MTQLQSFLLLILAGCIAYLLSCMFNYLNRCKVNYNLKKHKKDDIFKFKCKKLNFFEHINKVNRAVILLGRNISQFNRQENEILTAEFKKRVIELREKNSQDVFTFYYVPKAIRILLKEKKVIDNFTLKSTASLLLINDLVQGNIDDFYLFQERETDDKI